MLPTEQARFFDLVAAICADYLKQPTQFELESWWAGCKGFSLADVDRALRAHQADEKDGKHMPKPMDVKRRLSTNSSNSNRCAATDTTGRCEYPGVFSDGTSGEGSWYCPWHREDRIGEQASRFIRASREIPYEIARQKRMDRMGLEGQRTAVVVDTAHGIALRHGDKPWQGPRFKLPFDDQLSPDEQALLDSDAA